VDGINYLFIKKTNLFFVATTKFNVSPSFTLELLDRLAKVFKDYCGVLSEEALRKNFVLIYELLDEMLVRTWRQACGGVGVGLAEGRRGQEAAASLWELSAGPNRLPSRTPPTPQDYGYPQSTSTEQLKMYVHNEPIAVDSARSGASSMGASRKTISSSAVQKPISLSTSSTGKKNEIFVDILERLTVLFNANVRVGGGVGGSGPRRAGREAACLHPRHDDCPCELCLTPQCPREPRFTHPTPPPTAGLRAEQHHRWLHPDEVLPQRQPGPAPGAE